MMKKAMMRSFGKVVTAALSAVAIWSLGSLWTGTQQQAFAAGVGPYPVIPISAPVGYEAYKLSYFDVATAFVKSNGGYGGIGNSGGAGDALLRIVDAGNFESDTVEGGVCANIYVYNDVQEQQACCACPLSANSLTTFSVINNLLGNLANKTEPVSAGVIKIVGSNVSAGCGTSVGAGTTTAGTVTAANLAGGLHEWINHTEMMFSPLGAPTSSTSVEKFASATLDTGELANLTVPCAATVANNAAHSEAVGICICASETPPTPTPTPTSTPTPTPPIVLLGCKGGDNTSARTIITVTPATGVVAFDMAVIAIAYQSNTITVTPPATGSFPLISSTVEGDFTQNIYWHAITSASDDSWTFAFSGSVVAEEGVLAYAGTCLEDSTCPGGDPIAGSSALGQTGGTIQTGSAGIAVVAQGETVAMFGASETATFPFSPSGGLKTECAGNTDAALLMSDKPSAPPSEGPFTAIAPSSSNVGAVVSIIPK